jgi:hypothetical protein
MLILSHRHTSGWISCSHRDFLFFYFFWRASKEKQRYLFFCTWRPSSVKEICSKTLRSNSMKLNNSWEVAKKLSTCYESRTYYCSHKGPSYINTRTWTFYILIHILSNVILLIIKELRQVVCVLTRLWVERSGVLHRGGKRGLPFSKMHRTTLQPPTQPPFKWVPASFPPTITLATPIHLLPLYLCLYHLHKHTLSLNFNFNLWLTPFLKNKVALPF